MGSFRQPVVAGPAELDEAMAAFLSADEPAMRPQADRFVKRSEAHLAQRHRVADRQGRTQPAWHTPGQRPRSCKI